MSLCVFARRAVKDVEKEESPVSRGQVLHLYRCLVRSIARLPDGNQRGYYYDYMRQHFEEHREEAQTCRRGELLAHGERAGLWVLAKYLEDPPESIYDLRGIPKIPKLRL